MLSPDIDQLKSTDFLFNREVARAQVIVGVTDLDKQYAIEATNKYGLEPRETDLLAIENAFFSKIGEIATVGYWELYNNLVANIADTNNVDIYKSGWRFRWGSDMHVLNNAWFSEIDLTTNAHEAARLEILRGTTYNLVNEQVLEDAGLCVRQLGRLSYKTTKKHLIY